MAKFDPVNFVRQGTLIASAMIPIQQIDQTCCKVTFFSQLFTQIITNMHEDVLAKYSAILAHRSRCYPALLEEKKREEHDIIATAILFLATHSKGLTGDKKK
ncbi:hypothetical protein pipiens_012042 [Culex pipiens pipiens]|uniref:Uncharacterized protein n=1 Tax=Culex pipiens pipiens TaxID=38569 RepID=A0ABD1CU61_CULPP